MIASTFHDVDRFPRGRATDRIHAGFPPIDRCNIRVYRIYGVSCHFDSAVCTSVHVRTRKIYINAKLILGEIKRPARFRALLQRRFSNVLSFDYACRCCIMKRLSFVVARLIGYYYYFRKYSSFSTLHFCSISLGHRFGWIGKGIMAIRDGIACINILPNYVRSDCNWFNQRFRKEKIGGRETMRTKKGSSEAPDFYNPRAFFKSRDEKLGRRSRVFS